MRLQALATNYGKHSDEKLAAACASDLVESQASLTGQDALDMRRLELKLIDTLEPFFKGVADREHKGIADKSHDHLFQPLTAHSKTVEAMKAAVMAAIDASPFASKMDKEIVLKNTQQVAVKWIEAAQHMHRDCFARRGEIGNGTNLTIAPGWSKDNEHCKRWADLHDAPTPEAHRRALHELASGEKLAS